MKSISMYLTTLGFALLIACSSSKNTPGTSNKVPVAEAKAGATTVELLTDGSLETGLTPIYLKLTDASGSAVTDATVMFMPLMTMSSGMQHSCPVIGDPALGADGLYQTAAVFQMASSDMDVWSATVSLNGSDAAADSATFENLSVADSGRAQVFSYTDPSTSTVRNFVSSFNITASPTVGLNPVVFTLHEKIDMMTFTPIDDATVALDPQMPSMGHGSPGSVNPTPTSLGRYEGKVSFSMTGTWATTVTIGENGVTLGTPVFTTTF